MSSLTSELEQLPQRALLTAGFITYLGHVSAASELVLLYCIADSDQIVSSTYLACTQHYGTVHVLALAYSMLD